MYKCPICFKMLEPIYFLEKETKIINGDLIYTGREKQSVSKLLCNSCGYEEIVDDSFDGRWF